LTTERILGLDLLRGRKVTSDVDSERSVRTPSAVSEREEVSLPAAVAALPHTSDSGEADDGTEDAGSADTAGLPLFSPDDSKQDGTAGGGES